MRFRAHVLAAGVVAAAMLATTPSSQAAPAAPADGEPAPAWDTRVTDADRRSSDVALAVEQRPAFGGIRIAPGHQAIEIYVTHHDAALEAAARAAAGHVPVLFTRVRHSHKALRALQRRVLNDHRSGALGMKVTGAPVKDSLNRVVVELEEFTPARETAVLARYGRGNVVVRPGYRYAPAAASRLNDYAQWNSGSHIYSPQATHSGGCSSGPGVKNSSGAEYLLSAGHCFIDPDVGGASGWSYAVYNGVKFSTAGNVPERLGTAKARFPAIHESDMDIALMTTWGGGSGLSFVTTTPTGTSPFSRPQKAPIRAVEDTWVCFSGAYSGERCGLQVDAFDDPYPAGPGALAEIIHVNRAHHVFGHVIGGPGDSGGPVYRSDSDGLYVAGIIHGPGYYNANGSGLTCPNNSFYNRGTSCGSVALFTGINSTMAHFGVTLNTR